VLPPDVDTPGLAEENKIKPIECKMISEGSGSQFVAALVLCSSNCA